MSSNWRASTSPTPSRKQPRAARPSGSTRAKKKKKQKKPRETPPRKTTPRAKKSGSTNLRATKRTRKGSGVPARTWVILVTLAVAVVGIPALFFAVDHANTSDDMPAQPEVTEVAEAAESTAGTTELPAEEPDGTEDRPAETTSPSLAAPDRLTGAASELDAAISRLEAMDYLDLAGEYDFGEEVGVREIVGGYRMRDGDYTGTASIDDTTYTVVNAFDHNFMHTSDTGWERLGVGGDRTSTWAVWNRPVDMNNPGMLTPPLLRVVLGQATGVAENGSVTFDSGYTARVNGDSVYVVDDNGRAYVLAPPGADTAKGVDDTLAAASLAPYYINDANELTAA